MAQIPNNTSPFPNNQVRDNSPQQQGLFDYACQQQFTQSDTSLLLKQDNSFVQGFSTGITYQAPPLVMSAVSTVPSAQNQPAYLSLNYSSGNMIQQQFIHPHYENPQQTAHWTTDTNPLTSVDMKMTTTPSLCLTADKNPETRDKLKWHSTSSDSMELSQDRYIENLQKQLDDSHKAETEYKLRIQQLMDLVEKQTRKITELRDELTTCRLQNMPSTSTHNEE